MKENSVSVVAILRWEEPFVEEWIAYHRLLGVEHFWLYNDDPQCPLSTLLKPYADFVSVTPWAQDSTQAAMKNRQLAAYRDALPRVTTKWVAFIDGDEFIVLRKHRTLPEFLDTFADPAAILLSWHVFGHCGHYSNPPGLITKSLTRRKASPGRQFKAVTRLQAIASIESVHSCVLKEGETEVDANNRKYSPELYPGKTDIAHINHYVCRSFENWMSRVKRGDTHYSTTNCPSESLWRFDSEKCLKKFVRIAKDTNEFVDEYMLRFSDSLRAYLHNTKTHAYLERADRDWWARRNSES
jgi:Glycosyltransferase family 92